MGWFVPPLCMLYVLMGIGLRVIMEPVMLEATAQTVARLPRPGASLLVVLLWPLALLSAATALVVEAIHPTGEDDQS